MMKCVIKAINACRKQPHFRSSYWDIFRKKFLEQRRIQKPAKHLRWSSLQQYLTAGACKKQKALC